MRPDELEKMYRLEDTYWWFVGRRQLVRNLVQKYAPQAPCMLDAGCGTGGTMDYLQDLGEITGVDFAAEALKFCKERGHESLGRCQIEALPFASSTFDVVVCCDILEHLDDDIAGLNETLRVLKPGGVAIYTLPAYQWLWSEHDEALSHRRRYSARDFLNRLKGVNIKLLKISYAVTAVFPIVLAVRVLNRLRLHKMGKPHTQLMSLPKWANILLIKVLNMEAYWLLRGNLPFGTSLVAVVQKTEET